MSLLMMAVPSVADASVRSVSDRWRSIAPSTTIGTFASIGVSNTARPRGSIG